MHRIVWSRRAVAQLRAVRAYIEQFNPTAAVRVAEGLLASGDSLAHFPFRGRQVPGTDFRELVAGFRYIIRYRVTRDGTVWILRVRHTSRRPTAP